MAQPTPYDRQFNFQNQQALTPDEPNPGAQLDNEYNSIKVTLDEILANLELIQRDDGALANQSVGRAQLHSSIQLGFGAPTVWENNTNYTADFDTVFHEAKFYTCVESHLSDPSPSGFANDLNAGYWEEIADFTAAQVQGLGTMSTQDADDVEITGGSITGMPTPSSGSDVATKTYADARQTAAQAYADALDAAVRDDIDTLAATLRGELSAPTGTKMLFQQTSAPTGWTKDTTHNDKVPRLVSGSVSSGGSVDFSTAFARTATDGFSLLQTHLPNVSFTVSGITLNDPGHNHNNGAYSHLLQTNNGNGSPAGIDFSPGEANVGSSAAMTTNTTGITISNQGSAASGGSNTAHAHNIDLRVKYVDFIIATKNAP